MQTRTADRSRISATGLESVRAKAKSQSKVKFHRADQEDSFRVSYQKIKTLKSRAATCDSAQPEPAMNELDKLWDWFLRAIGNR